MFRFYEVAGRNRCSTKCRRCHRCHSVGRSNPYRGCTHACNFLLCPPRRTSSLISTSGRDFEREIVVKVNAPEVLRAELGRRSWRREHMALGTNTDPYQWVEGRYRLMRGIWGGAARTPPTRARS